MLLPEKFLQSCAMFKTLNGIGKGSGFLLKLDKKLYFITAKHVVVRSTNGQFYEELASLHVFSSISGKFETGPVLDLKLLKPKTLDNDLMSIEIGQYVEKSEEGIDKEEFSVVAEITDSGIFSSVVPIVLTEHDLDFDAQTKTMFPVYLLAFPSTSFRPTSGPLTEEYPLVRHGIVAGIQNRRLVLDCASHLGNSGGLVVAKIGEEFKEIGIINEFIPFVDELVSKHYPQTTMMTRYENSGLTIAMQIERSSLSVLSPVLEGRQQS